MTLRARNAVALSFSLNGFCFATWVSRIPEARFALGLDNGGLGLLLLSIAVGSLVALPTTGVAITRAGTVNVVRTGGVAAAVGLLVAAVGVSSSVLPITVLGLFTYGLGIGVWDVAMNVEGATVEQAIGRTVMPRFHAAFSLGTVAGSALGALLTALSVPIVAHLGTVAVTVVLAMVVSAAAFLPVTDVAEARTGTTWGAWGESRTVLIGLMVLALALAEGTANDWLAVALVDGYDAPRWLGVAGFGLFVSAMTLGRVVGPVFLDRLGRSSVLWSTMALAGAGVVLIAYGGAVVWVVVGIVLWGVGASLGFPVGMSAAADDPVHAAARVSVVSTIGYAAFLAGPPLLGFVGDHVGTLHSLVVVAVLLVPSALLVPAARPTRDKSRV